jgi:hypothetical protein
LFFLEVDKMTKDHISAMTLDTYLLDALSPEESEKVKAHLEICQKCQEAYRILQADCETFDQKVLPKTLSAITTRTSKRFSWWPTGSKLPILAPAMGAAAALLVVMFLWILPGDQPAGLENGVQIKGGASAKIFAQRGDKVFEVNQDVSLRENDRIRFVVNPGDAKYLLVISLDGREKVSTYFPVSTVQKVKQSGALKPGSNELPGSIELDNAPGPEKIFFIFSDQALDVSQVERQIVQLKGSELSVAQLSGTKEVITMILNKEN